MTACTQPACTGTIVDGYCDVCGSPAGAPRFIPAGAAASAVSPAPAVRTGLTAGRRGSGFPPGPRNCTQEGCIGTIVDGYCDVCGSPAGAPPFIPAVAAASAASPAPAVRTGLTAGRRGSGFPPGPRNCTQEGCIGTIVDGYCDVCGSPAGAPPFIPAVAAAHQPKLAEEERPTRADPSGADYGTAAICGGDGRPSSWRPGRETDPAHSSGADYGTAAICGGDGRPSSWRPGRETDPTDPSGADPGTALRAGDGRPSGCRPEGCRHREC